MTLCAGDVRRKHVYTTSTNSVEIRIVTKTREDEEPAHFVINYEGTHLPYISTHWGRMTHIPR